MKIAYCLTAKGNPLYNGEFLSHERYKTFGQHSFIIDFIATAKRNHCTIQLFIEGRESFPFQQYLLNSCSIHELAEAKELLNEADVLMLDELSEEALDHIPLTTFSFGLVHDAGKKMQEKCCKPATG